MELLTKDEYRAIAAGLDFPPAAYIDGAYRPAASGKTFDTLNPATGVAGFDEAIAVANDTPYGLCAALFTANAKRAIRGARMLRAGTVTVNAYGEGDIATPLGGFKQSVFGGRDNGLHAHDQYTQLKTIWIDLSDVADEAVD